MHSSTAPPTPSTVAIFGATGRTGRRLVHQALARGHRVKAFARTPAKIDLEHDRLEIVQSDVQDPAAVERGVAGVDAVITGGAGVGDPHDRPTVVNRVIGAPLRVVAPHVYEDVRSAVEVVRASNPDRTSVRLPRPTDDPATGTDRYLRPAPVIGS